jgi:hypothetical protein
MPGQVFHRTLLALLLLTVAGCSWPTSARPTQSLPTRATPADVNVIDDVGVVEERGTVDQQTLTTPTTGTLYEPVHQSERASSPDRSASLRGRVGLHPYYVGRILARATSLAPLAAGGQLTGGLAGVRAPGGRGGRGLVGVSRGQQAGARTNLAALAAAVTARAVRRSWCMAAAASGAKLVARARMRPT